MNVTADSIAVTTPLDTGGGNVIFTSAGDLTLSHAGTVTTDGGSFTATADSGAIGSGAYTQAATTNTVATAGGPVSITAFATVLKGAIDAAGGPVTLLPSQAGTAISLQDPGNAAVAGSTGADSITTTFVDASGNTYVAGTITGSATPKDFAGNPVAGFGGLDVFVAKLNSAGVQQWFKLAGQSGCRCDRRPRADSSGNVFVTGTERGPPPPRTSPA